MVSFAVPVVFDRIIYPKPYVRLLMMARQRERERERERD